MPKKLPKPMPQQVVVFKIKSPAKVKGERTYPTRTIALDVDCDLYAVAEEIMSAFDFDFDHAFGFFDNLNNPYQSDASFELLNEEGAKPSLPDILPADLPLLEQMGLKGISKTDLLLVMQAFQKFSFSKIQEELSEEISQLVVRRLKEKLQAELPQHLMPIVEVMVENLRSQMREEGAAQAEYAPIQAGVKDVSWRKAFLPKRSKMCFLFDYGDEWKFEVECLGVFKTDPKYQYPALLESKGKSPPQYPDYD